MLLEAGADGNKANRAGKTARMLASDAAYIEVMLFLQAAGFDNDSSGKRQEDAIQ